MRRRGTFLDFPIEPHNGVKKLKGRVDMGLTLAQRLMECREPAIGLEYCTPQDLEAREPGLGLQVGGPHDEKQPKDDLPFLMTGRWWPGQVRS